MHPSSPRAFVGAPVKSFLKTRRTAAKTASGVPSA